jgi:hypothetical protein
VRSDRSDLELLAVESSTIFRLSETGRILRSYAPGQAGPRLHLAGCAAGNVVRIRHDVGEETVRAIEPLAVEEPALNHRDSTPVHLDEYLRLLSAEAPVEKCEIGLVWTFSDRLGYKHPAPLVCSDTPEGDGVIARLDEHGMPQALFDTGFVDTGEFWAPWCVALDGNEIASIAFTVGVGPDSAEVGVNTMPAFRGRGLAAAATAGWAAHPEHAGHTLFYSTSRTNVSSQRVTERLGLRFTGVRLTIA